MLFFAGIFFVGVAIWMFILFIKNSRRPRVNNARVLELTKEPYKFADNMVKNRNFPHALVEYELNGVILQQKILLKSRPKIGDTVQLYVDSSRPEDVEQYHPPKEILMACIVAGIGIGMMVTSLILMDSFGW